MEQDDKPLNEDPIFLVDDVKPKLELIKREYTKLKGIKKPKVQLPGSNARDRLWRLQLVAHLIHSRIHTREYILAHASTYRLT